ncbi:hypothetical protein [Pseudomonas phoenicis]|uniref:hypothetical protein n=1 Tax=unclassified Pseudomonas TaxID=196821 RepID=UPI00399FD047
MRKLKITVLMAGFVLMLMSVIVSSLEGVTVNHWRLLAVPLYLGLALSFWKCARRSCAG